MAYDIDKPVPLTDEQVKLYADHVARGYTVTATERHGQIKITIRKPSNRAKRMVFAGTRKDAQERDNK